MGMGYVDAWVVGCMAGYFIYGMGRWMYKWIDGWMGIWLFVWLGGWVNR